MPVLQSKREPNVVCWALFCFSMILLAIVLSSEKFEQGAPNALSLALAICDGFLRSSSSSSAWKKQAEKDTFSSTKPEDSSDKLLSRSLRIPLLGAKVRLGVLGMALSFCPGFG